MCIADQITCGIIRSYIWEISSGNRPRAGWRNMAGKERTSEFLTWCNSRNQLLPRPVYGCSLTSSGRYHTDWKHRGIQSAQRQRIFRLESLLWNVLCRRHEWLFRSSFLERLSSFGKYQHQPRCSQLYLFRWKQWNVEKLCTDFPDGERIALVCQQQRI